MPLHDLTIKCKPIQGDVGLVYPKMSGGGSLLQYKYITFDTNSKFV